MVLWVVQGHRPRFCHLSVEVDSCVYDIRSNYPSWWEPKGRYLKKFPPREIVEIPPSRWIDYDQMDRACPKGIHLSIEQSLRHLLTGRPMIPDNCVGLAKRVGFCVGVPLKGRTPDDIYHESVLLVSRTLGEAV